MVVIVGSKIDNGSRRITKARIMFNRYILSDSGHWFRRNGKISRCIVWTFLSDRCVKG